MCKVVRGAMKVSLLFVFIALFANLQVYADRNLNEQANLHPLDTFTADVLNKGEWFYGQPPIPAPGYNFYGLTEKVTLQFDYTAWLGGVPSFNIRYQLYNNDASNLTMSTEVMLLYIDPSIDELDKDQEYLYIKREGVNGFLRLNVSYSLSDRNRLHGSFGLSYSDYLSITNENRPVLKGEQFSDLVDPAIMLGYEGHISKKLMFVANVSYGETWLLFENRPRKQQFVYGFRWLPFSNSKRPIFNNMAIDLIALFARFHDAEEEISFPLPLFPVLTWQWNG